MPIDQDRRTICRPCVSEDGRMLDADDSVTLLGVNKADLHEDDFII